MKQIMSWVLFGALFVTLVVPTQARPIDDDGNKPSCWHRCATEVVEPTALPTLVPPTSTPVPTATSIPATATAVPPTPTARPSATATARPTQVPTEQPAEPTAEPEQTKVPTATATATPNLRPRITNVTPLSARPGEYVTIRGVNFLSDATTDVTGLMVVMTNDTGGGSILSSVIPDFGATLEWGQDIIRFRVKDVQPPAVGKIQVAAGGKFDTWQERFTVLAKANPTPTATPGNSVSAYTKKVAFYDTPDMKVELSCMVPSPVPVTIVTSGAPYAIPATSGVWTTPDRPFDR